MTSTDFMGARRREIQVGEIVAYRAWYLSGPVLNSLSSLSRWLPGEPMTGDLDSVVGTQYNKAKIMGGVYALRDLVEVKKYAERLLSSVGVAIGTVLLSGDVIEGTLGYRASVAHVGKILESETLFNRWNLLPTPKMLNDLYHEPHITPPYGTSIYAAGRRIGWTSEVYSAAEGIEGAVAYPSYPTEILGNYNSRRLANEKLACEYYYLRYHPHHRVVELLNPPWTENLRALKFPNFIPLPPAPGDPR